MGGEMGGADDVAIVKTSTVGDEKMRHKVSSLSRTQQFVERQDSELCTLIDSLISAPSYNVINSYYQYGIFSEI